MLVVPFNPLHLSHIDVQDDQRYVTELFERPEYQELLTIGVGYTGIHKGKIVASAGIFPMTEYMGRAWAVIGQDAGRALVPISRQIYSFLIKSDYDRIDTPVRRGFVNGHRWCELLGFINETPEMGMKKYGYDGETYDMYAFFPKEVNHGATQSIQKAKEARHQCDRCTGKTACRARKEARG